jgi:glycosyltransferase involved in cell wall biosynthesis
VYEAVVRAFPERADAVHLLRHGAHLYTKFSRMTKAEAKATIHDFLVNEADLDVYSRENLRRQGVFLDPETVIIGGTGFITASKGTKLLYDAQRRLQQLLPGQKIAAVYVGQLREAGSEIDAAAAAELKEKHNGFGQFFLDTYLPRDMLAAMLRALDVFFYWPSDCTQSGIIAHALGAGATIASRDMEGVGETVRMAGGMTSADFDDLILKMRAAVADPGIRVGIGERALRYAAEFSWRNQFLRHLELAAELCRSRARRSSRLPERQASWGGVS